MGLRRGFKTEANEIAREVRHERGLAVEDPLDPWRLAGHLAISVDPLSALPHNARAAARHFQSAASSRFSAVTVFVGTQRIIVYNDGHSLGRQASDVAHELAHGLLLHPAVPAFDGNGCRNWNPVQEEEANWLAGARLVSEEAAIALARRNVPLPEAAAKYGVSERLMDWRLNVTGARIRARRRAEQLRGHSAV